jgi:hypothetical protein
MWELQLYSFTLRVAADLYWYWVENGVMGQTCGTHNTVENGEEFLKDRDKLEELDSD